MRHWARPIDRYIDDRTICRGVQLPVVMRPAAEFDETMTAQHVDDDRKPICAKSHPASWQYCKAPPRHVGQHWSDSHGLDLHWD